MSETAENCTHNCGTCSANCGSRTSEPQSFLEKLNPASSVKKVIGVVSGKGGVGKSLVTSLMACRMRATGAKVGILDADITGPSIPNAFGIHDGVTVTQDGKLLVPATSSTGIDVISSNMLLENETDPVIWRGPVIAGAVKQFWSETLWQDIDYMFVDMPPGTGDVPLTVFQSLPVNGIIIVTSPQELVSMIVEKAVNMAKKMNVPILGLVENMSYLECPDCGKKIAVFGESRIEEVAKEYGIPVLAQIPIRPEIAKSVDEGTVEYVKADFLDQAVKAVEEAKEKRNRSEHEVQGGEHGCCPVLFCVAGIDLARCLNVLRHSLLACRKNLE